MTKNNAAPQTTDNAALLRKRAIAALTTGRMAEGISLLEQALALKPADGSLHGDLGTAYWQSGNPEKAESHYKKALQQAPRNPYALNAYGAFLLEQWRLDEAGKLLKRALAAKPDNPETLNNLGLLHFRQGHHKAAEETLLQALRLNPRWANPYVNLGSVMAAGGQNAKAEKAFVQALKINPRNPFAWSELAHVLESLRRHDEARACYGRALKVDPEHLPSWIRLLALLERVNSLDEAREKLTEARRLFKNNSFIAMQEGKLHRRDGNFNAGIAAMEACRPAPPADAREYIPLVSEFFFELGQLYDRADDADRAFDCFSKANAMESLRPDLPVEENEAVNAYMERMIEDFMPEMAKGPTTETLPGGRPHPVFLVGFPRSGTTLLDQILTSHPDVFVAEEKGVINLLLKNLGAPGTAKGYWDNEKLPQALKDLTAADVATLQDAFFREHGLQNGQDSSCVFVDKLPLNIFQAGYIKRIFPQARFILSLRHPCDSILSCYMQLFKMNQAMMNYLDIETAAKHYDRTMRVWNHYAKTLPLDVHAIRYEDVVADFRPAVEGLLGFLGLPWNDAVLDYDKTARARGFISTPSYNQVTEKIYDRASGRWHRYRKHLEPALDILAPHAANFGYAMTKED